MSVDRDSRKLIILGCISSLSYLAVTLIFWTDAIFTLDWKSRAAQVAGIGLPAILYLWGIGAARSAKLRYVVGFAIVFALIGFATLPFDSTDVFFYMASGWHQSHYNGNPYANVLRDISGGASDGMIQSKWMTTNKNQWLDLPLPYGFLFAALTRTIAWAGRGNWWLTLGLFNAVNLVVHGTIALLLWKSAKLIPAADPKLILFLYAWNPFTIAQSLANVHNDILMAFFIVIAAYSLLRQKPVWSIQALVMATLIKYVAVILLPFAFLFTWRAQGWKTALKGSVLGALLAVLLSIPYAIGFRSFRYPMMIAQWNESSGSLHAFLIAVLHAGNRMWPALQLPVPAAGSVFRLMLWGTFAAYGISTFVRTYRSEPSAPHMVQTWNGLLFGAICLASSQFYSWYLGMFFPVAVLCAGTFTGQATIVMTATNILAFSGLRRKSIGFFLVCTLAPLLVLYFKRRGWPQLAKFSGGAPLRWFWFQWKSPG